MEQRDEVFPELLDALSRPVKWEDAKELLEEIKFQQRVQANAVAHRLMGKNGN
jgi:hypothetical protein